MSPHHSHIRMQAVLTGLNRRVEQAQTAPIAQPVPAAEPARIMGHAFPQAAPAAPAAADYQVLAGLIR